MSARLLRPRIQARPDNEMAARSRRLHHRVQMPYWLRDRNVEVKPHIYDRTVERRANSLTHPNRRRRYVDVRETGWQDLMPMGAALFLLSFGPKGVSLVLEVQNG